MLQKLLHFQIKYGKHRACIDVNMSKTLEQHQSSLVLVIWYERQGVVDLQRQMEEFSDYQKKCSVPDKINPPK